jgi:glycogen synthase
VKGQRTVALIVTPQYLPLLGGMERECALLASEFASRGFDPVVVTEQLGMAVTRDERDGAIRVHRIPSSPERSLVVQLRVALGIMLLALRYRRVAAFAIVRTTTLPSLVVGLLKTLRLLRFPTLVTAETGGEADDVVALSRRPLFALSRALVSANDTLNGICRANVDHLREHGFPEAKITHIPNGIDTAPWDASSAPKQVRRFLFLGRLDLDKGLLELLAAFKDLRARHPDVSLTIAGEGPARDEVLARCRELDLDDAVDFPSRLHGPALLQRGHAAERARGRGPQAGARDQRRGRHSRVVR